MLTPTINPNGTDADVLYAEAADAYDAVRAARMAVAKMTVHGRDFGDTVQQALADQHRIYVTLQALENELREYALALDMQRDTHTR